MAVVVGAVGVWAHVQVLVTERAVDNAAGIAVHMHQGWEYNLLGEEVSMMVVHDRGFVLEDIEPEREEEEIAGVAVAVDEVVAADIERVAEYA